MPIKPASVSPRQSLSPAIARTLTIWRSRDFLKAGCTGFYENRRRAEAAATQALAISEELAFRFSAICPSVSRAGRERNSAARAKASR